MRKPWSVAALVGLGACGGAGAGVSSPVGVSTAAPAREVPAAKVQVADTSSVTPVASPALSDWSTGLQPWSASTGRTHLYGEPTATWTTYANDAARTLLGGGVRSAPDGAELVAKVVSNTAGTAWLRMRKVQNAWVYDALDNGEPAASRSLSTCASCHVQSSTDSVYFSPAK